ncbi:hypothetical protein LACWKB10_0546 [Lactobacillus sp. wkB10]|nr:hypothetical protein LACWKB10_0546 [Lactobacillus sp. wkB10]
MLTYNIIAGYPQKAIVLINFFHRLFDFSTEIKKALKAALSATF